MLKLRGHHLLCLHFFNGRGYDRNFVDNLKKVLDRARAEGVVVAEGCDEVCGACPHLKHGLCHRYGEVKEPRVRAQDRTGLNLLELEPGEKLTWDEIEEKLPHIFADWKRDACSSCQWMSTCGATELWRILDEAGS